MFLNVWYVCNEENVNCFWNVIYKRYSSLFPVYCLFGDLREINVTCIQCLKSSTVIAHLFSLIPIGQFYIIYTVPYSCFCFLQFANGWRLTFVKPLGHVAIIAGKSLARINLHNHPISPCQRSAWEILPHPIYESFFIYPTCNIK